MGVKINSENRIVQLEVNEREKYDYDILKKRFIKVLPFIKQSMRYAFQKDPFLIKKYIALKKFYTLKELPEEEFSILFKERILNEGIVDIADLYVREHYHPSPEVAFNNESSDVINEDLYINNQQIQDLHKISFVIKLTIPIIGDYVANNDVAGNNTVFYNMFVHIMELFNNNLIIPKLYAFINSRIMMSQGNNTNMWEYLKHTNSTQNVVLIEVYEKILTLILYKIDVRISPIPLLHAAIKKQLEYKFRENFNVQFSVSKSYNRDADGVTAYEKVENALKHKDEGLLILNDIHKVAKLKAVFKNFKNSGLLITKEELRYLDKYVTITQFQITLVTLFYSNYLKTYNYDINKGDYILMLGMLYKSLSQHKRFKYLHKVLISDVDIEARRSIVKKTFIERLNNTKIYQDLVNTKYSFIKSKLMERKNPILNLANYLNNKFWVLPNYNEFKITPSVMDNKEYLELNKNIDEGMFELLLFMRTIL